MKRRLFSTAAVVAIFLSTGLQETKAQSDVTKLEVGGQFSGIRADNSPGSTFFRGRPGDRLDLGGGGRFSFNLNRYIALESELNFFKEKEQFTSGATQVTLNGTKIEGLFGAKAGIRGDKFLASSANCDPGLCISTKTLIAQAVTFMAIMSSRWMREELLSSTPREDFLYGLMS